MDQERLDYADAPVLGPARPWTILQIVILAAACALSGSLIGFLVGVAQHLTRNIYWRDLWE